MTSRSWASRFCSSVSVPTGTSNGSARRSGIWTGKVDALGVGGADIWVVVGKRRYAFRQIAKLVAAATRTPVVDGSGLKHTLERETIRTLQREGTVDFQGTRVLLVSAVDRFGMAQALGEAGANVVFGDLLYGVGAPVALRRYSQVEALGRLLLPVVTQLPFKWFYPTGEKQERRTPKFARYFHEADVICGDWHYIRRYAPDDMRGRPSSPRRFAKQIWTGFPPREQHAQSRRRPAWAAKRSPRTSWKGSSSHYYESVPKSWRKTTTQRLSLAWDGSRTS